MVRHLFRRKIGETETGKPIKAWYYWYYDPATKKRIRKSCGTSKSPVLLKRDADEVIERLAEHDREYLAMRAEKESVTIAKMAEFMFQEGSEYIKRRKEQGYVKHETTLKEIKGYLDSFIIEKFGHFKPEELDPVVVNQNLINMERSNSWRNRVVSILNFILDEAIWLKMIKYKPALLKYKQTQGKKSILSKNEMNELFPEDIDALSKIWNKKNDVTVDGYMFGTLFALIMSVGLRSGEARAIHPSQLIVTDGKSVERMLNSDGSENTEPFGKTKKKIVYGLIIDRMYNSANKIVMHLKKGTDENPKLRVTAIPEKTVKYLKHWISARPSEPKSLLFSYQGNNKSERTPIRKEYLRYRFALAVKNAKIDMKIGDDLEKTRKLTPHSLRFTYNTKMRRKISVEKLRPMMGHESEFMTDYYTVIDLAELEEQFIDLRGSSKAIDSFWG